MSESSADPVMLLNGGGVDTLIRCRDQYPHGATHLGKLARPRDIVSLGPTLDAGFKTGVDNEVYCGWDLNKFVRQIGYIERATFGRTLTHRERMSALAPLGLDSPAMGLPGTAPLPRWHKNLLWVTVPDVVGDAKATARRWSEWAPLLSHLPLALCVQDGAGDVGIPWSWPNLRALFMAGTTGYKLSNEMADICQEGKKRGLLIHCGRVNSRRRIRYLRGLHFVDSIDGSGFDTYRDTHLPWGLQEVAAPETQEHFERA